MRSGGRCRRGAKHPSFHRSIGLIVAADEPFSLSSIRMGCLTLIVGFVVFLFTGSNSSSKIHRQILSVASTAISSGDDDDPKETAFSKPLIEALDLAPLLHGVARHTGTRRGHQALLSLVHEDQKTVASKLPGQTNPMGASSRRQRAQGVSMSRYDTIRGRARIPLVPLATCASEARREYQVVEAATLATSKNSWNVTFPPLYGTGSGPWDTTTIEDTDNDEWLYLPADVWTLENVLQAEKVIETLLETKRWATLESTRTWIPALSDIASQIDEEDVLPDIFNDCKGRVEVARVRTLANPSGKSSFTFRLRPDNYPVLNILREKEMGLLKAGAKEFDKDVVALQSEIDDVESQIRNGLAQMILSKSDEIDKGLDELARLDVIFAKAAFGRTVNGVFPRISNEGKIAVKQFVHPVLSLNYGFSSNAKTGDAGRVVPIDLQLSNDQGNRVLLISGPNGGGKTLSMKSFGMVCILTKIGIPIPVVGDPVRPRVDFINRILTNVGDNQNLLHGESTWTSLLNSCSRIIQTVHSGKEMSSLVLLDELGSGTDPNAGGAVAQAILEELMAAPSCHIVATTHSPRLKSLSYESDDFACATVLLEVEANEQYKRPTFRLEYGVIGESYALGAASRCDPPFADSVLQRATQLMAEDSENGKSIQGDYIQALTKSMEEQVDRIQRERYEAERKTQESHLCRKAMILLAASYETHLMRLDNRLEDCYRRLREDRSKNDLEVIGETLSAVQVAKKRILSQKDLLREQGLRLLPTSYQLSVGESAVIIGPNNDWEGTTVQVVADATLDGTLGATEVLVRAASSFDRMHATDDRPRIVQRHELAIWDYDCIDDKYDDLASTAASVPDAKRRLNSLLSTLKSDTPATQQRTDERIPTKTKKTHSSARARKAAKKGKKK